MRVIVYNYDYKNSIWCTYGTISLIAVNLGADSIVENLAFFFISLKWLTVPSCFLAGKLNPHPYKNVNRTTQLLYKILQKPFPLLDKFPLPTTVKVVGGGRENPRPLISYVRHLYIPPIEGNLCHSVPAPHPLSLLFRSPPLPLSSLPISRSLKQNPETSLPW